MRHEFVTDFTPYHKQIQEIIEYLCKTKAKPNGTDFMSAFDFWVNWDLHKQSNGTPSRRLSIDGRTAHNALVYYERMGKITLDEYGYFALVGVELYHNHHMVSVESLGSHAEYACIITCVEHTSDWRHWNKFSTDGNVYTALEVDNVGVVAYHEGIHELRINGFYYGYPLPKDEGK